MKSTMLVAEITFSCRLVVGPHKFAICPVFLYHLPKVLLYHQYVEPATFLHWYALAAQTRSIDGNPTTIGRK